MATAAATVLIGREAEFSRVRAFLDAPDGAATLLLEGEPGIGKTTLWRAGVEHARDLGVRILEARPAASERELSFAGLGDLLDGVHDEIGELPGPQRRALRIALVLEEPSGEPPEPRAIAAALLGLLRRLAGDGRVVVALDDAHWLDPPSTGALQFALRRLDGEPIRVLVTARPSTTDLALDERLTIGPLSLRALDQIIRAQLGARFLRPTLRQLEEASGGNPFYALEIAASLLRLGRRLDPGEPLPIPATLRDLVRDRLAALSPAAREAGLAAAALAQPTVSTIRDALGERAEAAAEAVAAGVLAREGQTLHFTHPLLAATIYEDASVAERQAIHRRLAEIVDDVEERARHLAETADGPEEKLASVLDAAVASAVARGAPEAAIRLAKQAVELTPTDLSGAGHRRHLEWARVCLAAGDPARAEVLLERQLELAEPGRQRAEVEIELGRARLATHGISSARACYERALLELDGAKELQLRAIALLELADAHLGERLTTSDASDKAIALAEELDNPELLARALGIHGWKLTAGEPPTAEYWQRAMDIENTAGELRWGGPTHAFAWETYMRGDPETAAAHLSRVTDAMRRRGDPRLPMLLLDMSDVARGAGAWDAAAGFADEAYDLVVQTGREALEPRCVAYKARLALLRGDLDLARAQIDEALASFAHLASSDAALAASDGRMIERVTSGVLGRIAAMSGRHEEAHRRFAVDLEVDRELGLRDGLAEGLGDDIASLVALGAFEEAADELRELDELAETLGPPIDALAARAHGLVAAGDDPVAALACLERAVELLEALPSPWTFELGRTLLALGSAQRRARKKQAARESLERATEIFERLGARLWAEKARAELRQIGGRPSRPGALTETEKRVADLVATGRSNAEVAHELFMSPKTVEWNLSKIYRKLHVRSRVELAAKLARKTAAAP